MNFIFVLVVIVSFQPMAYTVTEGVDGFSELTLVRSGRTESVARVTVNTAPGLAEGK